MRIRHCVDCNVCVEGYDHHCPVSGKCIGKGNWYCFIGTIMFAYFGAFVAFIVFLFGVKDIFEINDVPFFDN